IVSEGLAPSAQTFGALVNAAVRVGDLEQAHAWLSESAKHGVNPGVVAYTTLMKGLCESGRMSEAAQALQEMLKAGCRPNLRTANTMLRGYRRAGDVTASSQLLQQMESAWGLAPDATSCEYGVALLCQGLRVKAARQLLQRSKVSASGAGGADQGADDDQGRDGMQVSWEGAGPAAQLRSQASLWTMAAEASLLLGEPLRRVKLAVRRAGNLRRKAAALLEAASAAGETAAEQATASTRLFAEFKERELERRAELIAVHIQRRSKSSCKGSGTPRGCNLLPHMCRLLALPSAEDKAAAEPFAVSAGSLLEELRRSYGLAQLLRQVPEVSQRKEAEGALTAKLATVACSRDGGELHLSATFADAPGKALPLKVELCSGEGEWVCAQAAADVGQAHWASVEYRRDRVFRTFSRAFLKGVSENLCVVAGDAALFLRLLAPGSVAQVFVNFPEPPVRRGRGEEGESGGGEDEADTAESSAPHLLTADTLRLVHRALAGNGSLLVHSDNVTYLRQLAASLNSIGGFAGVSNPGAGAVPDEDHRAATKKKSHEGEEVSSAKSLPGGKQPKAVSVWRGRPGREAGVVEPEASSYFARL
ncbi:unnamed protein product, partial [Polarella glacialis]